ncbi:MAG: hypothetical protein RBR47_12110 [Bacteroidales bacterium]|jgi:hypothetical protein|nr:hypothetical protein [Bacteroidales bacterium]NCA87192.1 hypothetical protein [Clostridia bacterium]MDD3526327.1 hypothetical protein [Bacteroidales bacterium]MDD4178060.1 hypothetical protein [Bacteroidales bacterium]MDD4740622.1 hypothetical protein [Bacteroidales bacterium]
MKVAGIILIVLGVIGLLVFGIQAANDSESFSFLGMDVAVSSANWTPVIISGAVLVVGIIMAAVRRK